MDWWQHVLLYVGIWGLGFFTGMQSGVAIAVLKLSRPQPPPQPPGKDALNPALMAQMMNQMGGPRQ